MRIVRHIAVRLLLVAGTLLGVSLLVFVAMRWIPGGFEDMVLGPFATEDAKAIVRARFGLDQPVHIQYWRWLTAALGGDLGTSMTTHQPILDEIVRRAAVTLELASLALLIAAGIRRIAACRMPLGSAS